jgi:hypothetical protein
VPVPTADPVPETERASGRKRTVGERYVETLGVGEVARSARTVSSAGKMYDFAGDAGVGRVAARMLAVSKAFGASSASSDLFKQLTGLKTMSNQYATLSTASGLAKESGLLSEAVWSAGMIDAVGLSAKHSAALAGLTAVPRIDPSLLAVSKAFGASSASSDLFKQLSGLIDSADPSAMLSYAASTFPAAADPVNGLVVSAAGELILPTADDEWVQGDSGLWTRMTPETYWAVLMTALFVSVCVGAYLSEMNRVGAPLSDTNRMSLALEVAGLIGLAKSVDAATRWLCHLITG